MKSNTQLPSRTPALRNVVLALIVVAAPIVQASTLWTGPNINFTQSSAVPTDVLVPGSVSLTRAGSQWLFNPAGGDTRPVTGTPTGTEWAFGALADHASLSYQSFYSLRNGDLSGVIVGKPMVVHLTSPDIYLSLTFSAWPQHGGFFAYTRSTPAVVSTPPTVSITSPTNGASFVAPAQVQITANASETGGSIKNVQFFQNGASVGTSTAAPYSATAGGLTAGAHTLSAVATDANGATATNSVQISVTAPPVVTILLSSSAAARGQFQFSVSGLVPGKTNLVQASADLTASANWISLSTNTATATSMTVSGLDATTLGARYFRVVQQP